MNRSPPPDVRYQRLKSEDRLPAVKEGRVDFECGSTTNTLPRQKEVAFSPVTFVTGTKLMVRRASGIRSHDDLKAPPGRPCRPPPAGE